MRWYLVGLVKVECLLFALREYGRWCEVEFADASGFRVEIGTWLDLSRLDLFGDASGDASGFRVQGGTL